MKTAALICVLAAVSTTTTAQTDFLSTIQGLLGGLGGGGNTEIGKLLSGFFNGQADGLGGGGGLQDLWKAVAQQFGIDPTDIAGITNKLRATKEFRDNLDKSRTTCAAITRDFQKNLARSSCPQANTVGKLVFDELLGQEQTLNYALDAGSYPGLKEAIYFCYARETSEHNTWAELDAYAGTRDGRLQRSRTACVVQMNKERRMCAEVEKVLCALTQGEHFECRRDSELRKFNFRAPYFDMDAEGIQAEKPASSLRAVPTADFARAVPHPKACDQLALRVEANAIVDSTKDV